MSTAAIVLAAGAGTRMKSKKPKVAHEVLGKPLVRWVIDAARDAGVERVVSVVGHAREQVVPPSSRPIPTSSCRSGRTAPPARWRFAPKPSPISTDRSSCSPATAPHHGGHHLRAGACARGGRRRRGRAHHGFANPFGYGRIVRAADGSVERIVEQKDATPEQAAITECNSGFYCFDARALFSALDQVSDDNAQGEFYLTDVLEICRRAGGA